MIDSTQVTPYLTGWVRALPAPGDVAAFSRGEFTVHLHGAREVRLTGPGVDADLRFYFAAARVAELSLR
jgi:hypothetical protein